MKNNRTFLSLMAHNSRRQFAAAVALLSVIPLLLVWFVVTRYLRPEDAALTGWQAVGVLVGVVTFLALGLLLISKYPSNIARLKLYLEQMVKGEFPDSVSLFACADDMRAIQEALNVLLGRLKARIETVEEEKHTLEKQLCQAQKLETIGILAAGITHEISAPVQFVRNNVAFIADSIKKMAAGLPRQSLSDDTTPSISECGSPLSCRAKGSPNLQGLADETLEAITESEHGLSQVADIAKAMKNYLHPGRGDARSRVDINSLLADSITLSRNEWKYVADIEKDFAPDLPEVTCVAGDIRQALMNLLINAAAAIETHPARGKGKGRISATTAMRDGCVEIRISDTGGGIAPEVQDRIFDRFFTTKEPGKGTGLGLSLSRTFIVNRHGGSLTFETELERGTTFVINLPVNGNPQPDKDSAQVPIHGGLQDGRELNDAAVMEGSLT